MPATSVFAPPGPPEEVESGTGFTPRFNADGLVPCIAVDAAKGDVLMVAWMNAEALRLTIETGQAHYWSRSRNELWRKGATSGMVQHVVEMRTDCDQDVVLIRVRIDGPQAACHTGRRSCFYRTVALGAPAGPATSLHFVEDDPVFDPDDIYRR